MHLVKTPVFTLVMINRVLIRLKIIQIVYAYYQNGSKNLDAAEKELFFSLSKAYDLYNYLLMLMIALTNYAQKRIDAAKAKLAPTAEELYPNMKFVENKFISQLEVKKTIKRFDEKNGANQPLLPEFKDDEDQEFARRLFRRAILNCDYYRHLISENTRNWDLDRVAFMDVVIMQCALAEILSFPNIPVSVSLNEYVDIAKVYSTAKSGSFVNGTLDGIVKELKKEGKLSKN